jgi:hypothetical protein
MSMPTVQTNEINDSVKHKWCPLCQQCKVTTVAIEQSGDAESSKSSRELTYCPDCGAMLRNEPNKKPRTGG